MLNNKPIDHIYLNGQFKGFGTFSKNITAVAIQNNRFVAFGQDADIFQLKDENTKIIDLKNKIVIPGLNDSHIHLIRAGLNFNLETRWDSIESLEEGLVML